MSPGGLSLLVLGQSTETQVVAAFGAPVTTASLDKLFGAGWVAAAKPVARPATATSCVYYLDKRYVQSRVFKLCYDTTEVLAGKAVLAATVSKSANGTETVAVISSD